MKTTMKIQKKKNKKLLKKKLSKMKLVQPYIDPTELGHQTQGINTWQPAMLIPKKLTQKKQVH